MKKKDVRSGISLIILIITIIVLIILIGATVYRSDSSRKTAQVTVLMTDLMTVQDSTKVYYVENGKFPTSDKLEKNYYTLEEIQTLNDEINLTNDIQFFNDERAKFYIIDLSKVNVRNLNFGLKYDTYGDKDVFVVSDSSFKVYYIMGKNIQGNMYYSLTSRLTGANDTINVNDEDSSVTSITSVTSGGRINIIGSSFNSRAIFNLKYGEKAILSTDSYENVVSNAVGENILILKNLLTNEQLSEIESTKNFYVVIKKGDLEVERKKVEVDALNYTLRFNSSIDKVRNYDEENTISFSIETDKEIASVKYVYYNVFDLNFSSSYTSYRNDISDIDGWVEYAKKSGIEVKPSSSLICTASLPKNVRDIFVIVTDNEGNTAYDIKNITNYYARTTLSSEASGNVIIKNAAFSSEAAEIKVSLSYDKVSYTSVKNYNKEAGISSQNISIGNVSQNDFYVKTVMKIEEKEYVFIDKISSTAAEGDLTTITSQMIKFNPEYYYGQTVKGYISACSRENTEWQIFYSDGAHIYLISKDYLVYNNQDGVDDELEVPNLLNGSVVGSKGFNSTTYIDGIGVENIVTYYTGSSDITSSNPVYNKLSFVSSNPENTTSGMKIVAYMVDQEVWKKYIGTKADYAIGGPTIEQFIDSYNSVSHALGKEKIYFRIAQGGYQVSFEENNFVVNSTGYSYNKIDINNDYNQLYLNSTSMSLDGYRLSSPCTIYTNMTNIVRLNGNLGNVWHSDSSYSYRPLIRLKQGVTLKLENGVYKVK